jgi:sugar/nucleoside kinase (ribokinase family)
MTKDRRRGFVTGGTWCVDRNKIVTAWPAEDGIAEILRVDKRGGGSGCNLAVDIRQLDPSMPVETIGLVGDDEDGRFLLAEADAAGIDRRQMAILAGATTNYSDAFISSRSGRRTHIYEAGTSALLTPEHFDLAQTAGRIFHLGLPGIHPIMDAPWRGDANGWVRVLKDARAAGLSTNLELVSIEPERIAALARPCLPHLDTLIVNDHEIGAIAGEKTSHDGLTDVAACRRAALSVLANGTMDMVVVHFPRGALAATGDGAVVVHPCVAVPAEAIVSANGAGDAFAAGMLYALHEGWPLRECLALAHAVAAASLRALSTTQTVVPWKDCLALAAQWGWRDLPT